MRDTKRQPPARLPLLLGLCMFLGLTGSCAGFIGVSGWKEPVRFEVPALPEPQEAAEGWEEFEAAWAQLGDNQTEAFAAHRPAVSALAAVNWLSSAFLFAGAWAAWLRSPRGPSLLHSGLVLSQAYALLGLGVGAWTRFAMLAAARSLLGPYMTMPGTTGTTAWVALAGYAGRILVSLVGMAAQFVFYWWMRRYLQRPEVSAALAPPA